MITVHAVIGGATQGRKRWHGMLTLHEKLIQELSEYDPKKNRIWFFRWCADWYSVAEHVWLLGQRYNEPVQVCVYAYSWGAGWGARKLAEYLDRADIDVRAMVLSDPVYRHWYFAGNWRAFWPWSKIRIPANVQELWVFYQRLAIWWNNPRGHSVKCEAPLVQEVETILPVRTVKKDRTVLHKPKKVDVVHTKMDDLWAFHKLVIEVAREVAAGTEWSKKPCKP